MISGGRNKSDSPERSAGKIAPKRVKQTRAHAGAADGADFGEARTVTNGERWLSP